MVRILEIDDDGKAQIRNPTEEEKEEIGLKEEFETEDDESEPVEEEEDVEETDYEDEEEDQDDSDDSKTEEEPDIIDLTKESEPVETDSEEWKPGEADENTIKGLIMAGFTEEEAVEIIRKGYERSKEAEESKNDDAADDEGEESEPEKESIADGLANETKDEVSQDVGWFKKKAREKVVDDPDSFREAWRRMRLLRHGHVILRTLSRDPDTGDFIRESTIVKMSELPRDAVQCTNEKKIYCLDTIKTSQWYQKTREDLNFNEWESQFTASDAALYMVSNKIDNALITKWTDWSHIDKKKIILPIAMGICILMLFIFWRM